MVSANMKLINPLGLHLRPAGMLCTEALKYSSSIKIRYQEGEVNAKSVLGVLAIGLRYGSCFTIICDGKDEEEALNKLKDVMKQEIAEEITENKLES
ncbi:MAG: HPr family phosphocarrier protein [Clostridium sp.]|nr:HPr family phosphocarrier protein [Clostridium sp.]